MRLRKVDPVARTGEFTEPAYVRAVKRVPSDLVYTFYKQARPKPPYPHDILPLIIAASPSN
jgi:hypothetical protein